LFSARRRPWDYPQKKESEPLYLTSVRRKLHKNPPLASISLFDVSCGAKVLTRFLNGEQSSIYVNDKQPGGMKRYLGTLRTGWIENVQKGMMVVAEEDIRASTWRQKA